MKVLLDEMTHSKHNVKIISAHFRCKISNYRGRRIFNGHPRWL